MHIIFMQLVIVKFVIILSNLFVINYIFKYFLFSQ